MELRDINYIVHLKHCSSISQAAKELYIPQPTLSNVLKRVETELGKTLFNRTKSGLQLTDAGRKFMDMAERLLEMNNEMLEEMASFEKEKKELRIGSPNMWCAKLVAPVAAAFIERHPGFQVRISEQSDAAIKQNLRNGEIDIGILHFPLPEISCYEYQELFDEQILIAVSSEYWEKYSAVAGVKSDRISLHMLANHRLIFTEPDRSIRTKIELVLKNNRIPYHISAVTNDLETSLVLAQSNVGFAFISDKQKRYFQNRYQLTYLRADSFLPCWKVVAGMRKDADSKPIKQFIDDLSKFVQRQIQ